MRTSIMIGVVAATSFTVAMARAQTPAGSGAAKTDSQTATRGTSLNITRAGSVPSTRGPAEWFTGTVRIDQLFTAPAPARAAAALVTFEPGARTAWHTHPLGQTLIVQTSLGRVQRDGSGIEEIRPGDVVQIPPGVRHWHGASPNTAMTHIAIQEALDGTMVTWLEHVSDEQYAASPRQPRGS